MKTSIRFKRYIKSGPFLGTKEIRSHISGTKEWHLNGVLHREDGPAIEWNDGEKEWWLNNKRFSEKEYLEAVKEYKTTKI